MSAKLPGLVGLKYGNAYDTTEQLGGMQLTRETFVEFQGNLYARTE